MKNKFSAIFCVLALGLIANSCVYKDLCYHHDVHAPHYDLVVKATYDQQWEYRYLSGPDWKTLWPSLQYGFDYDALRPEVPEGLRVVAYYSDAGSKITNLPPQGGTLKLSKGKHDLLFYNNDTEFIVFSDMQQYATAYATTRTRTRASYLGSPFAPTKDENTLNPPDVLYSDFVSQYDMTVGSLTAPEIDITMYPLVFTYHVRYNFTSGLEYVALARGVLAGMASEVFLNDGRTSPNTCSVLYDCQVDESQSVVTSDVHSFGIPDFPNENYVTKADQTFGLNLEVRLKNGTMLSWDFDVTDQVKAQPHGGVITVGDLVVTDEQGVPGSSGFLVDVTDWGEFNDIYIPFD